jgi:hypothetical protein
MGVELFSRGARAEIWLWPMRSSRKTDAFEPVTVAPGAVGGPEDGFESDSERGVEMRAAGGEVIAAGVGEGFLEYGQLAPVADGAGGDAGARGGAAGRIAGEDRDESDALAAGEAIKGRCVGHGCLGEKERPAQRAGLAISG